MFNKYLISYVMKAHGILQEELVPPEISFKSENIYLLFSTESSTLVTGDHSALLSTCGFGPCLVPAFCFELQFSHVLGTCLCTPELANLIH